jgi:hypothetical protein
MLTARLGTLSIVVATVCGFIISDFVSAKQPRAPLPTDSEKYLVPPSIPYGSRICRTMRLLATSTPEHKHRVRILFYGQSITGGWTDIVLKDLRARFPNADIVAENHAIGGFQAPLLSQTAEADLYPYYPDLLFLQDGGAQTPAMERMFAAIRNRTTAEVLTFTEHVDYHADKRLDKEGARIRELSEKYGYEVVDLRPSWWKYLEVHHMDRMALLSDHSHPNPAGKAVMASMVIPHLRYDPQRQTAAPNRVRYYDAAAKLLQNSFDRAAISSLEKPLRFEFQGNRVDVVAAAVGPFGTANLLIDGKKPSAFRELYAMTRCSGVPGGGWPAVRRVTLGEGVVPENWEMSILRANKDWSCFEFEVKGSVTGPDGQGNNKQTFTSNSGRLIIEPGTTSFDLGKNKKPAPPGYKAKWSVYGTSLDEWKPREIADKAKENLYTLAQGLSNGKHVLEIVPNGDGDLPVRYLVVYQPMPPAKLAPSGAK